MVQSKLLEIVSQFPGQRVVVVGDFMLDSYVFGDAERISPEAPVPVLRVVDEQERVGGAGSVAANVQALGGEALCFGLLGNDAAGRRVRELLAESGADVNGLLTVEDRPTIKKERLVGLAEHRHRQQIVRIDRELSRPPADADRDSLLRAIEGALASAQVLCIEDYAKGLLTDEMCAALIAAARKLRKPVLVDPARTVWTKYHGATLLTPNRAELEHAAGRRLADDQIDEFGRECVTRLSLDGIAVTRGRDGASLIRKNTSKQYPTRPRAVYDNTGAGDAVLAMLAMALAAGADYDAAMPLANIAGGLEVSKFGCVPIGRDEVLAELERGHDSTSRKLRGLPELLGELNARRQRGETIVFTNGCFDLLHPGHVELLDQAKAQGSVLVVGVNSDASVRGQNKGADRPIRNERVRARMISALESVDFVVLFDDPSVASLVRAVRPDVLVKGGDYAPHEVVGGDFVESIGGRVALINVVEGFSTSGELAKIRGDR